MTSVPIATTRVAAVMTVFNRRELTLACLRALRRQQANRVDLDVYVTDDASSDGTAAAIAAEFPAVTVLPGTGDLFWNGGMRLAFAAAMERDYDHYLWMNDDTILDEDALDRLLSTHASLRSAGEEMPLVVGATRDPHTGELTYSGVRRTSRWRPLRFEMLPPGHEPRRCDTMNGNCVLIPRAVAQRVGNIDPAYIQKMGDYDYGLRAAAVGSSLWIAPATVGTCPRDAAPSLGQRSVTAELRDIVSIKQLPPRAWLAFARRWAGPLWPLFWISPYVREAVAVASTRLPSLRRASHQRPG